MGDDDERERLRKKLYPEGDEPPTYEMAFCLGRFVAEIAAGMTPGSLDSAKLIEAVKEIARGELTPYPSAAELVSYPSDGRDIPGIRRDLAAKLQLTARVLLGWWMTVAERTGRDPSDFEP